MRDGLNPIIEEADTLAAEIVGILSHQRVDARRLLEFAGPDPFPVLFPAVRAIVRGTLDPEINRTPEITERFAELGATARRAMPDAADVMVLCGRTLYTAERHIARARPDLAQHDGWVRHWATISQLCARAAMFGHRRPAFGSDTDWSAGLHDPRLPQIYGLRAPHPASSDVTDEAVILGASRRIDAGDSAVIATDRSGTILYWNDLATRMYGWHSGEALGRNIVDVTPVAQARAEAEKIIRQVLGGRPWTGAFNVRTRTGTPLRAFVTDIPVQRNSEVVGIIGLSGLD
ncbi:MAG TPA: PAS domain-containing protein [Gemmatimonadaceae bacterium]|nr:PAS domain-containing protein [Gemmatimonadaceae bacterium]